VDAVGAVVDAAATAVPFVPGGAGAIIKAARAADKVADVVKAADNVADAAKAVDKVGDASKALDRTADTARGMRNPTVAKAVGRGNEAHKELKDVVRGKPGWQSEPTLVDPLTGKVVRPDAVTPRGHPIELKPRTRSGAEKGRRQLPAQERATGKKGRVIYYDP
jgi:hypothetical protein